MELIDKAAVVAEITNLKVKYDCGWNCAIDKVLEHIDDLEVKEMDLDKEIKSFTEDLFHKVFDEDKSQDDFDWDDIATVIEYTAKHFIELGIQQSNHNKNEEKSYRNHFVDWQRNTNINKPPKNHSILMRTTHGIAEGEWNGEKWIQYRWNSLLKDEDVLAWIELSNIEIPSSTFLNLDLKHRRKK